MQLKILYTHLIFYLILINISQVQCTGNLWKRLSCLSNILSYQSFQVDFYFSSNNQIHERITSENFDDIDFDPTRRTVVIIHGLTPTKYLDEMFDLRDEFLNWGDVNVIYVDWEEGCPSTLAYMQSVFNTEYAAIKIKNFFSHFIGEWSGTNKSVENWGPIHIIGLSLGAHVAGQAGELLKQDDNLLVDRITGLDPAEPCLDNTDSPLRLRKSNARFVDVIHTDGAPTKNRRLGLLDPVGHIDFYVNGGSVQPGCDTSRSKRTPNLFLLGYHMAFENALCHHLRSIILFTESLKQAVRHRCIFWAHPWSWEKLQASEPPHGIHTCNEQKCIEMGINAEFYDNADDIYYVATTGSSPYCYY